MIYAAFQSKNGRFCHCSVSGHAEFADPGQDIVCAAVSSAVQLTANLITESFLEQADISAEHDRIQITLIAPDSGCGASLLDGLKMHLQCISEDYPNTIKIKISDFGGGK